MLLLWLLLPTNQTMKELSDQGMLELCVRLLLYRMEGIEHASLSQMLETQSGCLVVAILFHVR